MLDIVTMPHWHAIHCQWKHEYRVQDTLGQLEIEPFLPTYKAKVFWTHRAKEVDRILFPGYVFAQFNSQFIPEIIRIPGVIGLCGGNLRPAQIPEHEIYAVRRVLQSMRPITAESYAPGDLVTIRRGVFAGVTGKVIRAKNKLRLYVAIEMLQRAVSVELSADDIAKAA